MLLLDAHKSAVYALAFSPAGDRLASGDKLGTVCVWDGGEPRPLTAVEPAGGAGVNALAFAPDGTALVEGYSAGWVTVGLADGVRQKPAKSTESGVTGLAFVTPKLLAVGGGNRGKPEGGWLNLVRTADAPQAGRGPSGFSAPKGVRAVAAAGERVAWSEWGRVLYVWDVRKPDRIKLPLGAEAPCLTLSPDGTQLAAGLDDYKVRLFDVAGRRERLTLAGHTGRVTGVAFSPDGATVLSGGWDGTVRVWDAGSGEPRAVFRWPVGRVTALAVSPDGLRAAAGGEGGSVAVADLD